VRLRDAIEGYLLFKAAKVSPETIKTDRSHLDQFIEWTDNAEAGDVTPDDMRRYLVYQTERGLTPHTVRRHHCSISALYNWLIAPEVGLAERNPARSVPPPKLPKLKPKSLTHDQIEALVKATELSRNARRDKALVLLLVDTGARASEVTNIKIRDVHFSSGKLKVIGKGAKERYVYLGKRALSALWLYVKDERPEPAKVGEEHLFLTIDGYAMDRHTLRNLIRRLAKRAGIPGASTHAFRHTAAIEHLRNGMDLVSLQHLLGHADITTTRIYLEALSDEDIEARAKRTSPADNWRL
jgi:integrase/recombinase XerD